MNENCKSEFLLKIDRILLKGKFIASSYPLYTVSHLLVYYLMTVRQLPVIASSYANSQ